VCTFDICGSLQYQTYKLVLAESEMLKLLVAVNVTPELTNIPSVHT